MKKLLFVFISTLCAFTLQAEARELKNISIQDALTSDDAKLGLPDDIKIYFGKEIHACDSGVLKSGVSISGDLVVVE